MWTLSGGRNHTRTVWQRRQRHQRSLPLVRRKLFAPVARKRVTRFAIARMQGRLSVRGTAQLSRALPSIINSTKAALNYLFASSRKDESPQLKVSVCGYEFTALLYSEANRVFVGSAGWRKLRALGFQSHSTRVE
jgi:hypothetical protein